MMHKIGIYLRVSTEEQANVVEGSLDTQKHRLESFIGYKNSQEDGWGKLADIYKDEGISAKDTRRPAFQRMMSDVRKGRINLILVTDLSRLSRNLLDFCVLLNDLKKYNAKFLSMKEQFDTSTAAGEMMVFNIMNLAQFERKQTSERVSMNFHSRALRGLRNGSPPVLGYSVDPENKSNLAVNEVEADQVRTIFKEFLLEGTIARTARKITELKIYPKGQKNRIHRQISQGKWSRATLHNLLRNPTYIGMREVNRQHRDEDQATLKSFEKYQVVKASWPAIVDEFTFKRVQKILHETQLEERARLSQAVDRVFILTGSLWCDECGERLMGQSSTGRNEAQRYYGHRPIPGRVVTCTVKRHRADVLEEIILKNLMIDLAQRGSLEAVSGEQKNRKLENIRNLGRQRLAIESKKLEVDRQVSTAIKMCQDLDPLAAQMVRDQITQLAKEKSELDLALVRLENEIWEQKESDEGILEFCGTIEEIQRGYKKASPAIKKRMIKRAFSSIRASASVLKLYYRMTKSEPTEGTPGNKKRAKDFSSMAQNFRFENLPNDLGDRKVGGASIVKIGRRDWI